MTPTTILYLFFSVLLRVLAVLVTKRHVNLFVSNNNNNNNYLFVAILILQLIYKSHAKQLSRLMDLILTVTSGKWKMSISSPVHVEAAIDTCVRSIMLLPASYKELKVYLCMSDRVARYPVFYGSSRISAPISRLPGRSYPETKSPVFKLGPLTSHQSPMLLV